MRLLMVVLLGAVLCEAASVARAEQQGDPTSFFLCSEKCDRDYEACMRWRTGKGTVDCPANLLKCRGACNPEWRAITREAAAPRSCRDKCQASFDSCMHADDGKHGSTCNKDVIVCRDACPPEEPPAQGSASVDSAAGNAAKPATAPPAAAAAPATRAAAAPPEAVPAAHAASAPPPPAVAPPASAAPPAKPEKAPERVGASEKASAPAAPIDRREAAPHPVPPARTVTNAPAAAARPETTLGPASAPAGPQGATRAEQPKRTLWARMWCSVVYCGSGATAQKPVSCDDACVEDYEACLAHEDTKRGGECAAASLRCRQSCEERKGS